MMKLAMVTLYPHGGVIRGGVEGVAYNLTKSLSDLYDVEIHIIAPAEHCEPGIEIQDNNITVHWIRISQLPGFIGYWTTFRRRIQEKLSEIKPDIAHFQGVAGWTLFYKKPFVLTIHGINENDVLYSKGGLRRLRYQIVKTVERFGRRRCKDTIIISKYVKDIIGHHIHGNAWDIENPISSEFFHIDSAACEYPVILHVGHINARKNVLNLLKAFNKVLKSVPDAKLHLAGLSDEDYLHECKSYIDTASITDNVVFLGSLNRARLLKELSCANCLALVSHQETAPMVIEEAMAASIPVVASDLCGIPFMIDDGKTGYLVDQNNIDDIADKLSRVLMDDELRNNMSMHCKEIAKERFHADSVAKKTMDLYKSVLY